MNGAQWVSGGTRRSVRRRIGIVGAAVVLLLVLAPATAWAHGSGLELTISPSDIAAGDTISVSGEGFLPGATVGLHLTGPNGDAHLGNVQTDDEGNFEQTVTIPGTVIPGLYLVRAQGDREASTELSVGAMAGMTASTTEASAEHDRSALWKIIAVVVLLGVAGLGAAITRPRHRTAAPLRVV